MEPRRFRHLPRAEVLGRVVPVAGRWRDRLLGLALLARERAGPGLLIPRCRGVHTFGMRFRLDLLFLDAAGRTLREVRAVRPFRVVSCRGAAAVLELPACVCPTGSGVPVTDSEEGDDMSLIDKLSGRAKKAAGDISGDRSLRRQGSREERKGEAKEKLDRAEEAVEDKAQEVSDLERKT
jgi:uncharacterized protein YjbJ (UPF0337 family)/uncharacterized membrane protein (UPF0127 family)